MTLSLLELFKLGGAFMWPLLLFSVAVCAIAIERLVFLLTHNLRVNDLRAKTIEFINNGDTEGAAAFLESMENKRMGARILLALVKHSRRSEHLMERSAETEAASCIGALESGFNFLTALGSLSPLTGFLGTVSGMIGAFRSIAEATEVNAQIVANGIYEALITTVFGLIIAIIAMVAHSLLSHVVDRFAAAAEQACSDVITAIEVKAETARESAAEPQG